MSQTELLEAAGPWWAPLLAVVLIGAYLAAVWAVLHAIPLLYAAHQRGLARVRNARHAHPRPIRSTAR